MARSGYEAVYEDLNRTADAEAVLDTIRMWLGMAKITHWSFLVHSRSGMAETQTVWSVRFGHQDVDFRDHEYTRFRFDFDPILEGAAQRILRGNFGVEGMVGTRYCKAEVALNGRPESVSKDGTRRGDGVRSYHEALLEYANHHPTLSALKREEEARIVGEMIRLSRTEEFAEGRRRAVVEAARQEIRGVMLKYRELPADLVDGMVREAQVNTVMEA